MNLVEHQNRAVRRDRVRIAAIAVVAVVVGVAVGFLARALEPVKTLAALPAQAGKDPKALPNVYWLRRYTADAPGSPLEKEKLIRDARAVSLNDREIGSWLNRHFASGAAPKEDIDAVAGAAFVRIGGNRPDTEDAPVLTVTMPYKLKLFSQTPDVNLQFTARPEAVSAGTLWRYADIRLGHARIPEFIAGPIVENAVIRYLDSSESGKKMRAALASYRNVTIRDGHLAFSAPQVDGR